MAISFVAASAVVTGNNPSLSIPAGYLSGDLLLIVTTGTATATTSTAPWRSLSAQGASQFITILYKFASTIEASPAVSLIGSTSKSVMLAYRGAGGIEILPAYTTGTGTTATPNTLTTTYANDFVINVYANLSGAARTLTANASTTSRVNSATTTTTNGLLIADELKAAAGVTTARAATISASSAWSAFSFAIIPNRTLYWVGGNNTWDQTTKTQWSNTSGGAGGVPVPGGVDAVIVDSNSGSPTITLGFYPFFESLTTTGATCTIAGATASWWCFGNVTLSATTTWSSTVTLNINGASTLTTNGVTLGSGVAYTGTTSQTLTLGSALTAGASFTFTQGTLNLSNNTLSSGTFLSVTTNTRVIQFGTGNITTRNSGTTFNVTGTNLTYTGTPTVNISNNSATAATVTAGVYTATNALNFNITTGTYAFTLTTTAQIGSLNFTGFTGSWSPGGNTAAFYRDLTLVAGMTYTTATTGTWTFAAAGTQTITSAGKTLGAITKDGVGTLTLGDALTMTSAGTAGQFTFTNGTINLAGFTLSCGAFFSVNTNTRVIQFGTSNITITGNASGSPLSVTASGLTYTGTPTVNISYSGAAALSIDTTTGNGFSATNAFDINATTGTYALTLVTGSVFKSLNFTGFTGSWSPSTNTSTYYGSLTLASGMTFTTGTGVFTFANTSGTATITCNGKTINPITQNGVGGTVALADALTMATTGTYTLTNGTFNASGFNFTPGLFSSNNSNTRTITMGSGTWTLSGVGTVWDLATTTGLTFNKNTANIVLSNTTTTARTFAGGALTYNNLTIGGATGISALTFTGANTFATLNSTKTVAHTITFPASTTTTVTAFGIIGTAGNLVTLNSSTAGTQATLSQATGTVNSNYLSIQDSNATGGAIWNAGSNSVNVSNNTGWIFTSSSNYFLLF